MIAIVFALEFEAADFVASSAKRLCIDVWQLGVTGHRAAGALERKLAVVRPSLVVSAGFCGALQPEVPVGAVFVAQNFTTPSVLDELGEIPGILRADAVCVPDVLATAESKSRLGRSTGAAIADMETANLFEICADHEIPFLSLRVVSDVCNEDLPVPGDVLIDPQTGRPAPALLFRYLLKNPQASWGLNRLIKNSKLARANLSAALHRCTPGLLRAAKEV